MMLGDDFHCIVVGKDSDVGMPFHGFNRTGLYLCARIVLMVEDAGGWPPLCAGRTLRSLSCRSSLPFDELAYLSGGIAHYFFHGFAVAYPVACNQGVFDVLLRNCLRPDW